MAEDNAANKKWRPATNLVRGGTNRSNFAETNEGIFMTSGYIYDTAEQAQRAFQGEEDRFIYSRFSNPTVGMFEERMALLEGAVSCRATATGMAAVFASLAASVSAGDRLVSSKALFGSCDFVCRELLPKFGIDTTMVNGTNLDEWEAALSKPTAAVFMETPSNPQMDIIDIKAVCEVAHKAGARVVVDNVFATPILQKPLEFGADVVVYSGTKHIDGQGRAMGGCILTDDVEWSDDDLKQFMRHTGPSLSPFNAWVHLKGLETLEIRVERHCESAQKVAEFLEGQSAVSKVLFPGLKSHPQYDLAQSQMSGPGTVVCFNIDGDMARTFTFLNAMELIDISNNLGDAKSLMTHPATTTHQRLTPEGRLEVGITDNLVRLSVGLEDVDDIIEDLDQALKA
ncbi:MAG: O-succinylhomoserine sulfhydrylase [Rhodospirillales bacterium]|jgi:O-succinylhomoserine sulfhydrylase|nr:O-succinylhomoserine sulfhydrylase [Rhodospirillales bacterium]MDP7600454.1 O-succinylhomoserine sulfhydrylase [Rhodospirillales bacterium]MDP7625188.1 O-succinylhomoserine sulfhydrylase [Rhodospirillales bacterium]|tara:strand:- start:251 stop:1447 length:1197 start_codon:yes stop_codon:yes gene_type:complete